ncbi:MAG: hypothetical protein IPK07_10305 [Deltaproteobacteria bacterium]|nr:hypothetical protein [Deltaproteobacteria bacterium]
MRSAERLVGLALVLAALLAAGCGSDDAAVDPSGADPAALGPFPVGVRTLPVDDPSREDLTARYPIPRRVTTEVWYPAAESARAAPRDPVLGFIPDELEAPLTAIIQRFYGTGGIDNLSSLTGAVRDAPIARKSGPYPLIALSHGNGSIRFQNFSLAEYLASHGFVVVAPDHLGNALFAQRSDETYTILNPLLVPFAYVDRVLDIELVYYTFLALGEDDPSGFFTGTIALGRGVGLGGHSFGGTTTFQVTPLDSRIAGAMSMAGVPIPILSQPFHVPALMWTAFEDRTIGTDGFAKNEKLYARSTGPRILAEVIDGGHFTFTDGCLFLSFIFDGDGCGEGERIDGGEPFAFIDPAVALPILNRTAVAFFRWTLKGDAAMVPRLAENPDPAWITYRADGLPASPSSPAR